MSGLHSLFQKALQDNLEMLLLDKTKALDYLKYYTQEVKTVA